MGFFEDVLSPGMIALITATMRAGKSNMASYLIEMGIPLGYHFYTNMKFYQYDTPEFHEALDEEILTQDKDYYRKVPFEVHTVDSYSELFLGLNQTKQNITIMDEAIVIAGSKKGVSKDIRWFEDFITQSGKFHTAIILISQAKGKLSTLIKEDLPNFEIKMFKISKNNRYAEVWFNPPKNDPEEPDQKRTWPDIPPSRYAYDHLAPGGFEPDMDIEKFFNMIGKLKSIEVKKKLPAIIEECKLKSKIVLKKKTKKELIMNEFYNNTNLTMKGLAKKYDTSYQNVCNYHRIFLDKIKESNN